MRLAVSPAAERAANSLPPLTIKDVTDGMATPGGFDWATFFTLIGVKDDLVEEKIVRVIDVEFFR